MPVLVGPNTPKTLGDLKTRIADELARSDLTSQIALAVTDAIDLASKNRFWFNEVRDLQIQLAANQAYHSDSNVDVLVEIDQLYLLLNTNQRWNLHAANNARLDALYNGTPAVGLPVRFSRYGSELRFWPTPDQTYTAYLNGFTKGQPLSLDTDSNFWTTYGEKLVRAIAKTILYAEVIRNSDEAERNDMLAQRYALDLASQSEGRAMTGEMEAFGV